MNIDRYTYIIHMHNTHIIYIYIYIYIYIANLNNKMSVMWIQNGILKLKNLYLLFMFIC